MIKLHEVGQNYRDAQANLELMLEEGLIDQTTFDDTLQGLQASDNESIAAWAKYLDELESFIGVLENKKRALTAKLQRYRDLAQKVELKVIDAMVDTQQKQIDGDVTVKLKGKASSLVVVDKKSVPANYYIEKVSKRKEINNALCKEVLEHNARIQGLRLLKHRLEII